MKDICLDGYVDSIKIRVNFVDKSHRNEVYNNIINFIKEKNLVAIKYDETISNPYCQITKLTSSNTTIATVTKTAFTHRFINQFILSIAFHGLHRYNKKLDYKSKLLLKNITAYLNTKALPFLITQFDICTDISFNIENLVALCVNRKPRKNYHPLGKYDQYGKKIQAYDSTYEIEKFESKEKRNNVMKLAYLYDKRKKEREKANHDIGYDISRLEVKFQSRFFLDKEISVRTFLQELKDYKIFYFEDIKQKDRFIKQYNKANNNKHRKQLIDKLSTVTPVIVTNMKNIEEFLRMVDTIKFDEKGSFMVTPNEYYLIGTSRLNSTAKK